MITWCLPYNCFPKPTCARFDNRVTTWCLPFNCFPKPTYTRFDNRVDIMVFTTHMLPKTYMCKIWQQGWHNGVYHTTASQNLHVQDLTTGLTTWCLPYNCFPKPTCARFDNKVTTCCSPYTCFTKLTYTRVNNWVTAWCLPYNCFSKPTYTYKIWQQGDSMVFILQLLPKAYQ